MKRHLLLITVLLLFCAATCYSLQGSKIPSFETPSEYFLHRELSNKRIPSAARRNPLSQPYKQRAETRYVSKGGWNSRITKTTPAKQTHMYDATLMYDTYDLDLHPYVLDVGCTKNGLYIRPEGSEESINNLKEQLAVGNLLVSRITAFKCHDHSLNDQSETSEKILYRLITKSQFIYNKENGISYFELETNKLSFIQLFSKLKMFMVKPVHTVNPLNDNSRWSSEQKNDKLFQTGWNVKKDSKGNTIYSGSDPQVDQANYKKTVSIFTMECQNCYFNFYAGYYFYVETDLPWDIIDTARGHGAYDLRVIFPSLKVTTSGTITKEFEVFPKKSFYTLIFAVGPVPVELSVSVGINFEVELGATTTVTFSSDYKKSGTSGFEYIEGKYQKIIKQTTTSGGFKVKDYSLVEASAKFTIKPSLWITFYELIPILVQINPYMLVKTAKNPKSGCKLGLDTYWGLDCVVGVDEIEFKGYTIWKGYTWDFALIDESKISSLSGICVKKSRRALDETFAIDSTQQLEEMKTIAEVITDSTTLVTRKITLAAGDDLYFDAIRVDMVFTLTCRISYGGVSIDLSSGTTDILIADVIAQGVSEITIVISKDTSESVTLNYYKIKTSLQLGQSSSIRAGLISFEEPDNLPDYLDVRSTVGTIRYTATNDIIPSLIKTSSITFPLLLTYEGADTNMIIYPVYTSASGDKLSHIVSTQSTKFAVKYSANTGLSAFTFENLVVTFSTTSKESIGVKLVTSISSVYDPTILATMSGAQNLDVFSATPLNQIPTYLYFEVTGTFTSIFELEFEILEVYGKSLSTDFSFDYITQSAYALKLYRTAPYANDGLVIEFDNRTRGYIGYNMPTEFKKLESIFVSTASRKNLFGISRQYHEGLLENTINLRVEARNPKITINPLSGAISVTFAGAISVQALKNQNLTIDISFVNNGKDVSFIDYTLLRAPHNIFMAINIEDSQYTFSPVSIANINTLVKFILSIKCTEVHDDNEESDWNEIILPLLVNEVVSAANGLLILENPQRMLIKLPIVRNLEKKVERVYFTTIAPHLFSPQPLFAFGKGEIDLVGDDLTPGDIGSVIASVVGFTIIGILLLVLIIVVAYLLITKKKAKEATAPTTTLSPSSPVENVVVIAEQPPQEEQGDSAIVELKEATPKQQEVIITPTIIDEQVEEQPTQEVANEQPAQEQQEPISVESGVVADSNGESQV